MAVLKKLFQITANKLTELKIYSLENANTVHILNNQLIIKIFESVAIGFLNKLIFCD